MVVAAGIYILKYFTLDAYEQAPLEELGVAYQLGLDFFLNYDYLNFFLNILRNYAGTILIAGLAVIFFIRRNWWIPLIVFAGGVLGYFFLVFIRYSHFTPDQYEPFERYLFPIPLIVFGVYFVMLEIPFMEKRRKINLGILTLIGIYHLTMLLDYGLFVKRRYDLFQTAIDNSYQYEQDKVAIYADNYYGSERIGHDWTMMVESILLTARKGSAMTKQVFVKESVTDENLKQVTFNNYIHSPAPFITIEKEKLNSNYFALEKNPLLIANTDGRQADFPEEFFGNIKIKIGGPERMAVNSEVLIPVIVYNRNDTPLYSGIWTQDIPFLTYHWRRDNINIVWDGLRTTIMSDVVKSLQQNIRVKAPKDPGNYTLVVDIVYEGRKWAEIKSLRNIEVY
jgi:hypothetical protein